MPKWKHKEKKKLRQQYGSGCFYCGRSNLKITIDHKRPFALGGRNSKRNRIPACEPCNKQKGKMPFKQFILFRLRNNLALSEKALACISARYAMEVIQFRHTRRTNEVQK